MGMDFFFPDQNPDLQRLPPEQVRIESLSAEPYPDGERIRVNLDITPFLERPRIEVLLTDADGEEVASASFIEPMSWKLEFTLHMRGAQKNGDFKLNALLFYPDGPQAEPVEVTFNIPSGS